MGSGYFHPHFIPSQYLQAFPAVLLGTWRKERMRCVWVLRWQSKSQWISLGNQLQQGHRFYRAGMSLPMGLVVVDTACLCGLLSDRKMSLYQMGYAEKT